MLHSPLPVDWISHSDDWKCIHCACPLCVHPSGELPAPQCRRSLSTLIQHKDSCMAGMYTEIHAWVCCNMEKYLDIPDCGIDKVAPATLPLFLGQDTGCFQVHICMLGSDYVPFACSWNTKYVHLGTANTGCSISKMWVTKQGHSQLTTG